MQSYKIKFVYIRNISWINVSLINSMIIWRLANFLKSLNYFIIITIITIIKKRSMMQGQKRAIDTLSVRRPQSQNSHQ